MNKLFFSTLLTASVITGLSACSECDICTKDSQPEVRICENDYNSTTEYRLDLDTLEASGYSCKKQ